MARELRRRGGLGSAVSELVCEAVRSLGERMARRRGERRTPMRRREGDWHDTKRAVASGMEDVKKTCTRCQIMKVRRREGKGGRFQNREGGMQPKTGRQLRHRRH